MIGQAERHLAPAAHLGVGGHPGPPAMRGESVHHKDRNRSNNDPDNLELWVGPIRAGVRSPRFELAKLRGVLLRGDERPLGPSPYPYLSVPLRRCPPPAKLDYRHHRRDTMPRPMTRFTSRRLIRPLRTAETSPRIRATRYGQLRISTPLCSNAEEHQHDELAGGLVLNRVALGADEDVGSLLVASGATSVRFWCLRGTIATVRRWTDHSDGPEGML